MKSEVLAQAVPIEVDKRKMKLQVVNAVEYFPEFRKYELYVGKVSDGGGWWNSIGKYVVKGGAGVVKWIGGYAFVVAKFITKQTFRGLGYVCNKIGDGFDDGRNYKGTNSRNVGCMNNNNIIPHRSNNSMVGNDCIVQQGNAVYNNKPIMEYNCSNSYEDIPSFDTLMREYSNK